MTDQKEPWPKQETIIVMTTIERNAMENYIVKWAHGKGLQHKLRETYKTAFMAGKNSLNNKENK